MQFELNRLPRNSSQEEILADIKRVSALIDKRTFTIADYEKHGKSSYGTIIKFFKTWNKALVAADLGHRTTMTRTEKTKSTFDVSNEEILQELKRISKTLNKSFLVQSDIDKHSTIISSSTVKNRFGSIDNGLVKAGLDTKGNIRHHSFKLTNDEILSELKNIAQKLNKKFISQTDLESHSSTVGYSTVVNRFGSWKKGLELAGLEISVFAQKGYTEDDLFENIYNVWVALGRQPKYKEMNKPPSKIKAGTYENRFGNYGNALSLFVKKVNSKEQNEEKIIKQETDTFVKLHSEKYRESFNQTEKKEDDRKKRIVPVDNSESRTISLRLRYTIMVRDNFRCVLCGNSPANQTAKKLHIDHIKPYSKGGLTLADNLRVLCDECNLGRGNLEIE